MHKVEVAAAYLISKYGSKDSLDKAKVSKVLYLSDWEPLSIELDPVTGTVWRKISCGPTSPQLNEAAKRGPHLGLVPSERAPADPNLVRIVVREMPSLDSLTEMDQRILDAVWKFCDGQPWAAFLRYVASTYPMIRGEIDSELDLRELYRQYQREPVSSHRDAVPA